MSAEHVKNADAFISMIKHLRTVILNGLEAERRLDVQSYVWMAQSITADESV